MKSKKILLLLMFSALLSSCSKDKEEATTPAQELMSRIGSLEEENKKLKAENKNLKTQLGISDTEEDTQEESIDQAKEEQAPNQGGKMIGGTPKGGGKIELQNASGKGDHIVVIAEKDTALLQVGMNFEDVETNGSETTKVYVDGKEKSTEQLSKESMAQSTLTLEGEDLKKGVHNVEVIQEINGKQNFYRLLTYEVK